MNKINDSKFDIAVIICTYKRESFVYKNVEKLNKIDLVNHIFVIDNADTIDHKIENNKIKVFPNKNLGGSGGFTRGIIEAKKINASYVFLMDDDIEFEEVTIIGAISKIKERNDDSWLGLGMSFFDSPDKLHELGALWNGINIKSNTKFPVKKYNYSAWWGLIFPLSFVDKHNYPMPFFIKFDDIEYGLRRDEEKIIFDNTLVVRHESFKKKFSSYLEYYTIRNGNITNCLHFKHCFFKTVFRFITKNIKHYLKGRFIEMKLANVAIDDFAKGVDFFLETNIEENNNRIMAISKQKINKLGNVFTRPFACIGYTFKLMFVFNKAKKSFRTRNSELTSLNYWNKVLGL